MPPLLPIVPGFRESIRALRECPHLRIEIWGTRFCGVTLDVGHPPKIESNAPEKMSPDATTCSTLGDQTTCVTHNLGEYLATRKGNFLTVEAPNGKLKFKIVGSW